MAEKTKSKKKPKSSAPKVELRSDDGNKKPTDDEVDEFVAGTNRWVERLKPHAVKLTVLAVLIVSAGIAWAVFGWLKDKAAMKATTALSSAEDINRRAVLAGDAEPPPPATTDTDTDTDTDEPKPFPDREARAQATLTALAGAEGLGAPAALVRARALMDLKKYDDAARAYGEAAKDLPLEAAIEARAGIGYAYEAKAEATEDAAARDKLLLQAIDAFKAMQPAADGPKHDAAMFHEARLLAVLGEKDEGKKAEAIAAYKKILETHSETQLKTEIEARLEMLGAE